MVCAPRLFKYIEFSSLFLWSKKEQFITLVDGLFTQARLAKRRPLQLRGSSCKGSLWESDSATRNSFFATDSF